MGKVTDRARRIFFPASPQSHYSEQVPLFPSVLSSKSEEQGVFLYIHGECGLSQKLGVILRCHCVPSLFSEERMDKYEKLEIGIITNSNNYK